MTEQGVELGAGFRGQSTDGAGGTGVEGSAEGQKKPDKKTSRGSIWARGGGMIYAKAADIPPPFSSTCFLKRSEKLETASEQPPLYSLRGT